jgi:hypothetical protein
MLIGEAAWRSEMRGPIIVADGFVSSSTNMRTNSAINEKNYTKNIVTQATPLVGLIKV